MELLKWIGAFFGVMCLDFVWGKYIQATNGTNPLIAGLWAIPIFLLGGVITIGYISDPNLLIPAAFGAFAGTYLSVKWKQVS